MQILRVALPVPLRKLFDYLPPKDGHVPLPGVRLLVPFGRRQLVGVLIESGDGTEVGHHKLRRVIRQLDEQPILDQPLMSLVRWVADYYHCPHGEAMSTALPRALRSPRDAVPEACRGWRLTANGDRLERRDLSRAPLQRLLWAALLEGPAGAETLAPMGSSWRNALRSMISRGWVEACLLSPPRLADRNAAIVPELNSEQRVAFAAVELEGFSVSLLDGVTGSGKTEVYLRLIGKILKRGGQALLLVPEIGLTPQLVRRFEQRLESVVVVIHSGMSAVERHRSWHLARAGLAGVVIGTRSALFTPLKNPGIMVIDEEHDSSLKQQDGLRYSARDVAVVRARRLGIPLVLGSATPSLESYQNVLAGRYRHLKLTQRAGTANPPAMRIVDLRHTTVRDGLSEQMCSQISEHAGRGNQVMVFVNRRGFAPIQVCPECGWHATCHQCDSNLTLHRGERLLRCHHCDVTSAIPELCPGCRAAGLEVLGAGTERVAEALRVRFPSLPLWQVDRDTTRGRHVLSNLLTEIRQSGAGILVGTQMLAKGHHFPRLTMVGVVNVDQGLFSSDFRAGERLAQLLVQVAGRAGRADRLGEVLIQTYEPQHALFRDLLQRGYESVAGELLQERRAAELPPCRHMAVVHADAPKKADALGLLEDLIGRVPTPHSLECIGPLPAPMGRRANRFRVQLVAIAAERPVLHGWLNAVIQAAELVKRRASVHWAIDVDPLDVS